MKLKQNTLLGVLAGLGLSTLTNSAAVVIYFEQVGDDVVADWSGTIQLSDVNSNGDVLNWQEDSTFVYSELLLASYGFWAFSDSRNHDRYDGGTESSPSFPDSNPTSLTGAYQNVGFLGGFFFIDGFDNNLPPTEHSYDLSSVQFTWDDTTLLALGVESLDNVIAWTSATGDTITYHTVPEPSGGLLVMLGAAGLMMQRRRKM